MSQQSQDSGKENWEDSGLDQSPQKLRRKRPMDDEDIPFNFRI